MDCSEIHCWLVEIFLFHARYNQGIWIWGITLPVLTHAHVFCHWQRRRNRLLMFMYYVTYFAAANFPIENNGIYVYPTHSLSIIRKICGICDKHKHFCILWTNNILKISTLVRGNGQNIEKSWSEQLPTPQSIAGCDWTW